MLDQASIAAMPQWQSHKVVRADRIASILPAQFVHEDGTVEDLARIELECGAIFELPFAFRSRHEPVVGGYLVVYEDGYSSFSPARPFEAGYQRIY